MAVVQVDVAADGVVHGELLESVRKQTPGQSEFHGDGWDPVYRIRRVCVAHLSVTIKLLVVGFLSRPSEAEAELVGTCEYKRIFLEPLTHTRVTRTYGFQAPSRKEEELDLRGVRVAFPVVARVVNQLVARHVLQFYSWTITGWL